jgi:hypothetical protein
VGKARSVWEAIKPDRPTIGNLARISGLTGWLKANGTPNDSANAEAMMRLDAEYLSPPSAKITRRPIPSPAFNSATARR